MRPTDRKHIHPGEVLKEEFLKPLEISQRAFAEACNLSPSLITLIIQGKRRVTIKTAKIFAKQLGTRSIFWIKLQAEYDFGIVEEDSEE